MKIAVIGDIHWSETSSIVRQRTSDGLTKRLHNLMQSIQWVVKEMRAQEVDLIVQVGDFFDKSFVTGVEGAALREAEKFMREENKDYGFDKWSVLLGNHELDGRKNTLSLLHGADIIETPKVIEYSDCRLVLLPYIAERDRKDIREYVGAQTDKPIFVISHNDIAGVRYGQHESTQGFPISALNECCDLVLNGHIHNAEWVTNKVRNVGNLTGQNFGENGFIYKHGLHIIDTSKYDSEKPSSCLTFIENPFAIKFATLELCDESEIDVLECQLKEEPDRWVLAIRTSESLAPKVQDIMEKYAFAFKKTIIYEKSEPINNIVDHGQRMNHIERFCLSAIDKFGESALLGEVLNEIR